MKRVILVAVLLCLLVSCTTTYTVTKKPRDGVSGKDLISGITGGILTGASVVLDILTGNPVDLIGAVLTVPMVVGDFERAFNEIEVERK